jgi:hypothetical protein
MLGLDTWLIAAGIVTAYTVISRKIYIYLRDGVKPLTPQKYIEINTQAFLDALERNHVREQSGETAVAE